MVDGRINNPRLKGIVSGQWGYYGLPPSKLSCFYYALPFLGYLSGGGFYPRGRSQDISNAFAGYIGGHGGKVVLNTRVEKILVNDHAATGVVASDGTTYRARVIVSNANAFDTFRKMVNDKKYLAEYESAWAQYSVSLSCFQVFLGLRDDLVTKLGIPDSEIFIEPSYDPRMDTDVRWQQMSIVEVSASHFTIIFLKAIPRREEYVELTDAAGIQSLGEIRKGLPGRQQGQIQKGKKADGRSPHSEGRTAVAPGAFQGNTGKGNWDAAD